MTAGLQRLAFLLGSWANMLPALWRKRIYNTVKVIAALATVFLLIAPDLGSYGIDLPNYERWTAIATALLFFTGQLASRNTDVPVVAVPGDAPESGEPGMPADVPPVVNP